jgi:alkylation response protein AidB-like acyl-CoA dehydrogenase
MTASLDGLRFVPYTLPPHLNELRAEVRAFLKTACRQFTPVHRSNSWDAYDAEFSAELGARGWLGMTLPKAYGGHERGALDRYVVVEELLAAGAPTGFHWVADRQSGPLLARYGTEEQKKTILPEITAGKACFAIGMSEPNSGSDLASLRTRAQRTDAGWLVNGQKIWTSHAHKAHYMIALFRTDANEDSRHAGLSQFLIKLPTKGITCRPIKDLSGRAQFNEVFFEDALLPHDALIGEQGGGWKQVMEELTFERSGPERYLSCFVLLSDLIDVVKDHASAVTLQKIGSQIALVAALRNMSLSVAGMLHEGKDPNLQAAVVKDVGCSFEQGLPGLAQEIVDLEPTLAGHGIDYQQVLGNLIQLAPSFSLRGGTPEILRGIIARGLGLR